MECVNALYRKVSTSLKYVRKWIITWNSFLEKSKETNRYH